MTQKRIDDQRITCVYTNKLINPISTCTHDHRPFPGIDGSDWLLEKYPRALALKERPLKVSPRFVDLTRSAPKKGAC
jgi:hypothetical protein